MRLEKYITDLLYRYQCVTVPEFGAFLTQRKPAEIHESTQAFYPPSKTISFNEQLKSNDGLLAKHIADIQKIPYEKALKKIAKKVNQWKDTLAVETLVLDNIGALSLNDEGNLQFQPAQSVNYLTASFGLSSFVMPKVQREVYKEEVEEIEEKAPILFTPEKREKRPYFRYAAVAAVVLTLVGTVGFNQFQQYKSEMEYVQAQEEQDHIENSVQQATFDLGSLPSLELNVTKEIPNYHVVAGAFRIEANADKKVRQLRAKGYEAERIGKNRFGLHQVTYASFSDKYEALDALRRIKREETREAWLLVTK